MSSFAGFVEAGAQIGLSAISIKPKRGIFVQTNGVASPSPYIVAPGIVIEENHVDTLDITDHPVEQGASITDHAFKLPATVVLRLGWSNSAVENALLSSLGLSGFGGSLAQSGLGILAATSGVGRIVAGTLSTGAAAASFISGFGSSQIRAVYDSLLALQASRSLFTLYTGKRVYSDMLCRSLATETDSTSADTLFITMECQQIILVNTQLVNLPKDKQKNPGATASPAEKGTNTLKAV